jgi:hypothetical protein
MQLGVPMTSTRDGVRPPIKKIAVCAIVLAGLASLAPATDAATLYVDKNDPSCSNFGPGSLAPPFCPIGIAAAQVVAGDTVVVRVAPASGDFHLKAGSPAIDSANSGVSRSHGWDVVYVLREQTGSRQ